MGDPIPPGNLDGWDHISAGNLDGEGIPYLHDIYMGGVPNLQET